MEVIKMKTKKTIIASAVILIISIFLIAGNNVNSMKKKYRIVDTGQNRCFDNYKEINYPKEGDLFYGQDAQYEINPPSYLDNNNGTITDQNTGLIWQKSPDFIKRTLSYSKTYASSLKLAGFEDWRLPTIKELFSIADFKGNMHSKTPYIDTTYFDFQYPDISQGGRDMDAQYRSSTLYKGITMGRDNSVFGFNFADGRIKAYPISSRGGGKQYVRCVRGNSYGKNQFKDNGNKTVTDQATELMWMKIDSNKTMTWQQALEYAKNLNYAGYNDWRLPNVKELQSIVDYSGAPDAKDKADRRAAIDPIFELTRTESWFWSSTTHIENRGGYYVCFGQGFSAWLYNGKQMNAHGAGAVRSDPKSGDPSNYSNGKGPQGDEIRILNFVRCVRGGDVKLKDIGPELNLDRNYPEPKKENISGMRNRYQRRQGNTNQAHKGRFIQRLDKNRDGKVSKTEFDGPRHHFNMLDKNNDGFISANEAPKGPPRRSAQKRNRRNF